MSRYTSRIQHFQEQCVFFTPGTLATLSTHPRQALCRARRVFDRHKPQRRRLADPFECVILGPSPTRTEHEARP